jgi:hypothetical protein
VWMEITRRINEQVGVKVVVIFGIEFGVSLNVLLGIKFGYG